MTTHRIHISGDGRMGKALMSLLQGDPASEGLGLATGLEAADAVIDYSHPDWTGPLLDSLLQAPRPILIGTTGLTDAIEAQIAELAQTTAVIVAPNTGTGIQVLRTLVGQAAQALGSSWDVEVLEMHHRRKVDAPSGTAWALLEAAGGTRTTARPARVGETGARSNDEVGIQSLRGGDVVGEHTVYLVGEGERIELTHRAWDRNTFARGGLRAVRWLLEPGRSNGLYTMADVLGLS